MVVKKRAVGQLKGCIDVVVMDYDRTIADEALNFMISESVKKKLKSSKSYMLVLATGRKYEDIPDRDVVDIFDAILSENGTILTTDRGKTRRLLIEPQWLVFREKLVKLLCEKGIIHFVGDAILAAMKSDSDAIGRAFAEAGVLFDVSIEYNKEGLLILPTGWNKGRGTRVALKGLGDCRIIAVGDDLNDLSLYDIADVRVAVKNAVPELKNRAEIICGKENGEGVVEAMMELCGRQGCED